MLRNAHVDESVSFSHIRGWATFVCPKVLVIALLCATNFSGLFIIRFSFHTEGELMSLKELISWPEFFTYLCFIYFFLSCPFLTVLEITNAHLSVWVL